MKNKPFIPFLQETENSLSVELHASGGSGALGFVAEVITLPVLSLIHI